MKVLRRFIGIMLIVIIVIQLLQISTVFAVTYGTQPSPEKVVVSATNLLQPPIGYNKLEGSTGFYVDIGWDPNLKSPVPSPSGMSQYINIYAQEIKRPYKSAASPNLLKEGNVSTSDTPKRLRNFSSGTMYNINTKAFYTYPDPNPLVTGTLTSGESAASNSVKVLTDINISASPEGTNAIKIVWDDVWDVGRRIDYKLYISDNPGFANTLPIHIGQDLIGQNGPISVDTSAGKLSYTYSHVDPAKVYYVKIAPDIADPDIIYTPESISIPVSSHILVRTTKISEIGSGANAQTIWQLDWTPVITGLDTTGITVTYELDKYDSNHVPIPVLLESGTTTFITLPSGLQTNTYIIRATVLKNGLPLYPNNVNIVSEDIIVKDSEVVSIPPTPEIVDKFDDSNNLPIITYTGNLKPDSATILWRAPRKADGTVDEATLYDIWLISDPNHIDSPNDSDKKASSLQMNDSNKVMDGTKLLGYKYTLTNLTPNATYYFKIVAKKTYVEFRNGVLANVEMPSTPALKTIITPTQGPIDQPLVPASPPFKVKIKPDGNPAITDTQVTVQVKNKWYEFFNGTDWFTIDTTDVNLPVINPPIINSPSSAAIKAQLIKLEVNDPLDPADRNYRVIQYDDGVTLDVGCVPFTDGMALSDVKDKQTNKVVGFSVTPNDPDEDKSLNYDNKVHNINIPLTGLDPNTTYIIWVRASRQSVGLTSGPSNPLVVTTNPTDVVQVEKPIVPTINYTFTADTYVDLGWDMKAGYNYYIKYGTVDDIAMATGSKQTSTSEITSSGLSFYRVKDLTPNTLYYFWIQAEATNGTLKSKSEWSDSFPLQTKPYIPPNTPRGFGVKSPQNDNITKNSITFEWIPETGMQYIIEISSGVDYKDVKEYKVGTVSQYTISGLTSNFRYFARLYAFDQTKNLRSEPTQSISVRTKRSSDDYDSDQDIENVISGDYIVKDPSVIKGVWTVRIVGANADRFVEHVQKDNILDYSIDLSNPPSTANKIKILISSKVFESLNGLGENIRVITNTTYIIIRPNVLVKELAETPSKKLGDFTYEIAVTSPSTTVNGAGDNLIFKTKITEITINAYDGSNTIWIDKLNKPLKISIPYSDSSWYKEGITSAYIYDGNALWNKALTMNKYDIDNNKGMLTFESIKTGNVAIADIGKSYFDDIAGTEYESSIINVAAVHNLKSISGRMFKPDMKVSISDGVKLALDILEYKYGTDYMNVAVKSKLVSSSGLLNSNVNVSRQNAIAMIVRLYELKTGEIAQSGTNNQVLYSDMNLVDSSLLPKVLFAIKNGLIVGRDGGTLAPSGPITRGEFMGMLEKLLALTGEID